MHTESTGRDKALICCPAARSAGDLLTALLLAWLDRYPDDLKQAVETAIASLQGIVQRTYESVGDAVKTDSESAEVRPVAFVTSLFIILRDAYSAFFQSACVRMTLRVVRQ